MLPLAHGRQTRAAGRTRPAPGYGLVQLAQQVRPRNQEGQSFRACHRFFFGGGGGWGSLIVVFVQSRQSAAAAALSSSAQFITRSELLAWAPLKDPASAEASYSSSLRRRPVARATDWP